MSALSPNMSLILPTIGVDSGLVWEQGFNSNVGILDQHNHAPGSGVQIGATGINLTTDLPFNSQNAITLRSARFTPQGSALAGASDIGCIYVAGVDLYYNDVNGNQIQITTGGGINATSSGISSGTASASFVSSVLVVLSAVNTPASIKGGSLIIGNTGVTGSHYCTLSPPSALAANYSLTLPPAPAFSGTQIMAMDSSGNMSAPFVTDNVTITSIAFAIQLVAKGVTAAYIADGTITTTQISASAGILGTQLAANTITQSQVSTGFINSGNFTATVSGNTNISSVSAGLARYMRVGNTVTVSGIVVATSTSTAFAAVNVSLPISSSLSSNFVAGTMFLENGSGDFSAGWAAALDSGRITLNVIAPGGRVANWYYTYTYSLS